MSRCSRRFCRCGLPHVPEAPTLYPAWLSAELRHILECQDDPWWGEQALGDWLSDHIYRAYPWAVTPRRGILF